jgi:hypothetical protein
MPGKTGKEPEGDPDRDGGPELDTRYAHSARVYNYWLGGKDNISQVVPRRPYSDHTGNIQAAHDSYSNFESLTVRELYRTCMGFMSVFSDSGS